MHSISIHLYIWNSIVDMSYNSKLKDMKSIIRSTPLDTILKSIKCIYLCFILSDIVYIHQFHNNLRLLDDGFMMKLSKLTLYLRFFFHILFLPIQNIHLDRFQFSLLKIEYNIILGCVWLVLTHLILVYH